MYVCIYMVPTIPSSVGWRNCEEIVSERSSDPHTKQNAYYIPHSQAKWVFKCCRFCYCCGCYSCYCFRFPIFMVAQYTERINCGGSPCKIFIYIALYFKLQRIIFCVLDDSTVGQGQCAEIYLVKIHHLQGSAHFACSPTQSSTLIFRPTTLDAHYSTIY